MKHAIRHIHFVGLGGSGMSGIAEVLFNLGYRISGSDLADSATLRRLQALGIATHIGHAAALLAGRYGHGLPVGQLLVGALALEFQHAALGQQRRDAGSAQLGGFFHQPVHALVRGDAGQQVHGAWRLALDGMVPRRLHAHAAAAHVGDGGIPFAAGAVAKQRDAVARLQAQHLHMARGAGGQFDLGASRQFNRAMETRHQVLF